VRKAKCKACIHNTDKLSMGTSFLALLSSHLKYYFYVTLITFSVKQIDILILLSKKLALNLIFFTAESNVFILVIDTLWILA
jgi:hypothetical protein